jgi:pyridoxine 5-phosphate synthase
MKLGVNIDHIAVLREARRVNDPEVLQAIWIAQRAGADQITIHLREDRRHIQDQDVINILNFSPLPVNLECALEEEIIDFVCKYKPQRATIVPEKREEVTTEGGLNVIKEKEKLQKIVKRLQENEIEVSLFIDPSKETLFVASELGVEWIEFHTGEYSNLFAMLNSNLSKTAYSVKKLELSRKELKKLLEKELKKLKKLSKKAKKLGLKVAAGHGLNYQNVSNICSIKEIEELNIGQSIIARSIFSGLEKAILDMKVAING